MADVILSSIFDKGSQYRVPYTVFSRVSALIVSLVERKITIDYHSMKQLNAHWMKKLLWNLLIAQIPLKCLFKGKINPNYLTPF